MPRPWSLFRQAWRDYRAKWQLYAGVILVVTAPVSLLSTYAVDSNADSTFSAYLSFAQLAANVALLYAVTRTFHQKTVTIKESYYRGSALLIRFVLVWLVLLGLCLPVVLAGVLIALGIFADGIKAPLSQQALTGLLAFIISIPSFFWLARSIWAIYIVAETSQGPVDAIRSSWALSFGHTRALLGRMVALSIMLAIVLAIPLLILGGLKSVTGWRLFGVLLEMVAAGVVIPISNLYMYRLYRSFSE